MSRMGVTLRVTVDPPWRVGTRVQVYTNFGTGAVDTSKPLLAEPVDVFAARSRGRGIGRGGIGLGTIGGGPTKLGTGGIGRGRLGVGALGHGPDYIEVPVVVPDAYGAWLFAAEAIDPEGNVQTVALTTQTVMLSGRNPAPVNSFALVGHDGPTDIATFSFA